MKNNIHSHFYKGITSLVSNHTHAYSGETNKVPDFSGHVHYLSGYTTVANGHTHHYALITGPAIEVSHGHIHNYMTYTTVDQQHNHYLQGYTYLHGDHQEPQQHFTKEEARQIGNQLGID